MKTARALLMIGAFVLGWGARATPQVFRVNGSLFDASGVAYTGSRDLQIQVYDAASGGNLLWTSSVYAASVTAGRFSMAVDAADTSVSSPSLKSRIANLASTDALWFEIHYDAGTAGNGSMNADRTVSPRIRAKGTSFSLAAASADTLDGLTAAATLLNYLAGLTSNVQTQLDAKSGGAWWTVLTGDTTAVVNRGYFTNSASRIVITLPTSCAVGDIIRVAGQGSGGWRIAQNSGQTISWPTGSASTGAGGYCRSLTADAVVTLQCRAANTDWYVTSQIGNVGGDYVSGVSVYTSSGTLTIPTNVTEVTVKVWGAGGGGGGNYYTTLGGSGGGGAYAMSVLSVSSGDLLDITVGTGGSGGASSAGGGGGGYSKVAVLGGSGGTVIAGGGGGGGGAYLYATGAQGGPGGFTTGLTGVTATYSSYFANGGGGGTQSAGGSGGAAYGGSGTGSSGSSLQGGNGYSSGGRGGSSTGGTGGTNSSNPAGGGGGGYYGGGGGGSYSNYAGGAGGGGSSYGTSGLSGVTTNAGNNTDSDYTSNGSGNKGTGGGTGASSGANAGSAGQNGMVIIKW